MTNRTVEFEGDPLRFMERYQIGGLGYAGSELVVQSMSVEENSDYFQLKHVENPQESRSAQFYLLGWGSGKTFVGRLGWAARYFFTGPFSGCSFGLGGSWMFPTVGHSNINKGGGNMFQSAGMDFDSMDKNLRKKLTTNGYIHVGGEAGITVIKSGSGDTSRPAEFYIFGWRWYGFWYFYQVDKFGSIGQRINKLF
ncbi:MAG: hypothetical protein GY749_25515 [Desulfobacteraceae bacterium]|nr:hypothetical protein [Desulfobacteraceae bacterium]